MSRPRWSAPSQCSAEGRPRVPDASVAMGSWVSARFAKIAVTVITSMMNPPAAPRGFLRMKRPSTVSAPGRARAPRAVAGSSTVAWLAAIAHPRVEETVEHVHEEVGEDHHHRDEHDQVLHDRIVAPEDGLDEKARDAGQVEHVLGDDEAADEEGELDADDGDHGQDRVLQRMAPDDDPLGLPLGPCRPDIVLAHDRQE